MGVHMSMGVPLLCEREYGCGLILCGREFRLSLSGCGCEWGGGVPLFCVCLCARAHEHGCGSIV